MYKIVQDNEDILNPEILTVKVNGYFPNLGIPQSTL